MVFKAFDWSKKVMVEGVIPWIRDKAWICTQWRSIGFYLMEDFKFSLLEKWCLGLLTNQRGLWLKVFSINMR